MCIVKDTAKKLNCSPRQVFDFANRYARTQTNLDLEFRMWLSVGEVPAWCENICIDIMAGREINLGKATRRGVLAGGTQSTEDLEADANC